MYKLCFFCSLLWNPNPEWKEHVNFHFTKRHWTNFECDSYYLPSIGSLVIKLDPLPLFIPWSRGSLMTVWQHSSRAGVTQMCEHWNGDVEHQFLFSLSSQSHLQSCWEMWFPLDTYWLCNYRNILCSIMILIYLCLQSMLLKAEKTVQSQSPHNYSSGNCTSLILARMVMQQWQYFWNNRHGALFLLVSMIILIVLAELLMVVSRYKSLN